MTDKQYSFHPIADIFPMMSDDELQDLANDIKANGLLEPIVIWQNQILDGRNRYRACAMVDVLPRFEEWKNGSDPVKFVVSKNLKRRHLDESQRAMVAARLANMQCGDAHRPDKVGKFADLPNPISQPVAADMLNIGERSVRSARAVIEHGIPELVQAVDVGDIAVSRAAKICQQPYEIQREIIKVPNHINVTLFSHKSREYYTPKEYADAARAVMGKIDLDPASCDEAQKNIGASEYYTEKDDGLIHDWCGRIWLNPPYSKTEGESNQAIWSHRLVTEYESGNVTQAILLVKAALGYKWFEELWDIAPAVCFARNRLSFILEDGTDEGQSKQGTAFFYFGKSIEKFIEVFTQFGRVMTKNKVYQCR